MLRTVSDAVEVLLEPLFAGARSNWLVKGLTHHPPSLENFVCLVWEVTDPALSTPSPTPEAACYLRGGYTNRKPRKQSLCLLALSAGVRGGGERGTFCSLCTCRLGQRYTTPEATSWHCPVIWPTVLAPCCSWRASPQSVKPPESSSLTLLFGYTPREEATRQELNCSQWQSRQMSSPSIDEDSCVHSEASSGGRSLLESGLCHLLAKWPHQVTTWPWILGVFIYLRTCFEHCLENKRYYVLFNIRVTIMRVQRSKINCLRLHR